MVIRACEAAGVCLLAVCAITAPLLAILWWRGNSSTSATFFQVLDVLFDLWIIASVAVALRRWPTVMAAAAEADRQFELADLLATTVVLDASDANGAPDLMSGEVLAMADERCRSLSPSQMVLRRLGSRTWGGIGLSLALVSTLALIPVRPSRLDAADGGDNTFMANALAATTPTPVAPAAGPNQHVTGVDPVSEGSTMMTTAMADQATASQSSTIGHSQSARAEGTGGGESHSDRPAATPTLPAVAAKHGGDSASGEAAGGSTDRASNSAGDVRSGVATAQSRATAQWRSSQSPREPSNDPSVAAPSRVPSEYRDLVREYFRRD
jgi:hypothetical protein